MPSRVFASVFADAADQHKTPRPTTTGTRQTNFLTFQALEENLHALWLEKDYTNRDGYDLLLATVKALQQCLSKLPLHNNSDHDRYLYETYEQAFVAAILPRVRFETTLSVVLFEFGIRMLNFGSEACADLSNDPASRQSDEEVKLQTLLCGLREVGLGGDRAAAACTRALEGLLYALLDESEGTVPETEQVVLEKLMPLVCTFVVSLGMMESSEQVDLPPLSNLEQSSDSSDGVSFVHSQAELENIWLQCADHIMARRLAKQLYGTIVTGTASDSIVKSMENLTKTPRTRGQVAVELQRTLHQRLLNSGQSTVNILDSYVLFISTLKRVDISGVLLARVSEDISQYLRMRDDAVRIVILSLLEPTSGPDGQVVSSTEFFSGQVSRLMVHAIATRSIYGAAYYPGKDLRSLIWQPEPVDAAGDHTATRNRDALGYMVTIKDKDAFIEELRAILGERLLKSEALQFDQEERLLAMFKTRFEDFPIRECEIMIKDMQESLSWHRYINAKQIRLDSNAPQLEVKVLSHTYWPTLKNESLVLPAAMQVLEDNYSAAFHEIKRQRKLDWLNLQGRVTVQLDFEDRTISEEVTTLQAAVIYQFESVNAVAVSKSVLDIQTALGLDEDELLRAALTFWVGKLVLRESPSEPDIYSVIESLTDASENATEAQQNAVAAAAAAAAAQANASTTIAEVKSSADLLAENAELYTNFVVNMLTNQGHMPASRMMMMLKMLIAGGFPFEEHEFEEFLEGLASEGKVEKAGGLWMAKRV